MLDNTGVSLRIYIVLFSQSCEHLVFCERNRTRRTETSSLFPNVSLSPHCTCTGRPHSSRSMLQKNLQGSQLCMLCFNCWSKIYPHSKAGWKACSQGEGQHTISTQMGTMAPFCDMGSSHFSIFDLLVSSLLLSAPFSRMCQILNASGGGERSEEALPEELWARMHRCVPCGSLFGTVT